jgi:ABC-2 type transport system permease protein
MSAPIIIKSIILTAEKNVKIYYKKPPVIIFGLLFPLFIFLSFYIGRNIDMVLFFPGFIAMTLFFTASAVGPMITPWEKQAGTYERLLSYPVTVSTIILGDVLAGLFFGIIITVIALISGIIFLNIAILNFLLMLTAILLGGFCFAALGVLLAAPSSKAPSNAMMLSSLIKFPLIFISGIFIPLQELSGTGLILSYISPLTYLVDIFHSCFNGYSILPIWVDLCGLIFFSCIFVFVTNLLHKRNLAKGI